MSEDGLYTKLGKWIDDFGLQLLQILIFSILPLIIGVLYQHDTKPMFGVQFGTVGFFLLILTSCLSIFIGYFSIRKEKRVSILQNDLKLAGEKIQNLENSNDEYLALIFELSNDQLAIIFQTLNLTANERISIYKQVGDKFVIFSRYSLNPIFKTVRENSYSQNEGFFSIVWNHPAGELFISDLPEFNETKKQNYFAAVSKHCTISKDRLYSIRMKSRTYYLKTINDMSNQNRIAIIVFESLNEHKFTKDELNIILDSERVRLINFIEKIPNGKYRDTTYAHDNGF